MTAAREHGPRLMRVIAQPALGLTLLFLSRLITTTRCAPQPQLRNDFKTARATRLSIMAGPKYQDVPQRDSLDEAAPAPSYSQAPPSYQADDPQEALLRGVARDEDDNLPDDFKFGGVVAEATLDIRMAFVRKVYAIL